MLLLGGIPGLGRACSSWSAPGRALPGHVLVHPPSPLGRMQDAVPPPGHADGDPSNRNFERHQFDGEGVLSPFFYERALWLAINRRGWVTRATEAPPIYATTGSYGYVFELL